VAQLPAPQAAEPAPEIVTLADQHRAAPLPADTPDPTAAPEQAAEQLAQVVIDTVAKVAPSSLTVIGKVCQESHNLLAPAGLLLGSLEGALLIAKQPADWRLMVAGYSVTAASKFVDAVSYMVTNRKG